MRFQPLRYFYPQKIAEKLKILNLPTPHGSKANALGSEFFATKGKKYKTMFSAGWYIFSLVGCFASPNLGVCFLQDGVFF